MAASKKGPSVTKTLLALTRSDPSNRSCADCWSALVDPSDVSASLCPSLETVQSDKRHLRVSVALHDFHHTHRALAPQDIKSKQGLDPSTTINQRLGGHGLFICSKCAEAHRTLGENVTKVMALQDSSVWTQTEAEFMSTCGGNTRSRTLYEAYIPDVWQKRRPNASSSLKDRVLFCKAKYEALAFVMPPPGPLSMPAWQAILERNETAKRYKSAGLMNIHSLAPAITSSESNSLDSSRITGGVMPNRLIDFFCMVTNSLQLHPEQLGKDLSKLSSPEDILLWPHVADCYPVQGSYSDMIFPEHLPSFVLPHGCRPTLSQPAPTFFTFVLTQGDGDRIYGGALQIYDEHMEMEDLKTLFVTSGYEGDLPSFLDEPEIVFLPKCLILLSHYPFFDLFRESLLQLYRISLLQAPLPIERYVANLVSEIPLPPRGKVRVEFGFTSSRLISIERPPPNELPLANFSYRPLFASLSTGNIMVVLGCLMEECKVVLLSSQCSLLTPVAEALMSAIFPFEWQGLYIPVLPYSITDILEAPVPFLVGLDSRYFKETTPRRRPRNVVFVDLDRDVVHLGVDELTDTNRKVPRLPPHDAQKLKASLDHSGGTVYLLPRSGIKGCIMEGHEELLLIPNEERPKYAHMQSVMIDEGSMCRESVLARARKAYDEHHLLKSVLGFRAVDGQLRAQDGHESDDSSTGTSKMHRRRRPPRFTRNKQAEMLVNSIEASGQAHLLDLNDPEGFSPAAIRKAFLRFMAATFSNYGKCITSGSNSILFDERRFLRDLGEDVESTSFVGRVLKTQMFQRFLEERVEDPENTEIRFFDESILAKLNRSKVSKMQKGGKFATPFLDDESGRITKTYTPPPPSNRGLPESNETFHYTVFPLLEPSLVGQVRSPTMWAESNSRSRRLTSTKTSKLRKAQQDILRRAILPLMKSPSVIASAALKSARDLETALSALKILQWEKLEPKRSQGPYSEAQTPDTSLHSAHASRSVERGESEKTVKTLSQADTIVMNARRKQAILLDEVVALQAVCRMHAARGRYKYLRESIIILQRKFRCQESLISGLTSTPSKAIKHQILCVQRYLRGYTARKRILQSKLASILIQSTLRGYVARRRYTRFKSSGLLIQCHLRGRRDRQAFSSIKFLVCKVQGHVRGSLVRAKVSRILRGKMNLFQSEIVHLWQVCHVPLSIRTKFWPALLAEATFTKIHVAELELKRLWSFIGATTTKECPGWAGDEIVQVADTMGIDSAVYRRCLELNRSTDYIHFSKTEEASLAAALSYVEAERLQIHERLDSKLSGIMATQIYGQFGISSTGKMKKLALAKALWTEHRHAEPSRSTMLTLFPELNGSLSISFQPASSKSKRRFPSATNFPVLAFDNESWDNVSLEGLIRKHSKEVTHLFITKVPGIMARLDACQRSGTEHRLGSVQRHRAQKYLFGRLAEIESRAEPNCERHPAFQKIEHDSV